MKELDIIKALKSHLITTGDGVICGIGDDCAVLKSSPNRKQLISTDTMLEGRHFDLRWHPAFSLACKAIAVNASDIAAMGGEVKHVTISLTYTDKMTEKWLADFLSGLLHMQKQLGINIVGGDTVCGDKMSITVTILGETDKPIYRSGAMVGDSIYVTEPLGSAAGGLLVCSENHGNLDSVRDRYGKIIDHHLCPPCQLKLAQTLAASGLVTSMQDISDGLATDLAHIASSSHVQAEIYSSKIPIVSQLQDLALEYDKSSDDFALLGGDDYLLVFTVKKGKEKQIEKVAASIKKPIYRVGKIVEGSGVILKNQDGSSRDVSYLGYQH
ncbi:MAG: thiamine-phosphate kinase [Desulfotalea sp.]